MRAAALLPLILALAACGRSAPEPPAATSVAAPVALTCADGFETLVARIKAAPGLAAAPPEPGEPYRFYNAQDGRASYLVTEPGAPGHPAILLQQAVGGGQVRNSGCPFGDRQGYDQLTAYLESLARRPK